MLDPEESVPSETARARAETVAVGEVLAATATPTRLGQSPEDAQPTVDRVGRNTRLASIKCAGHDWYFGSKPF